MIRHITNENAWDFERELKAAEEEIKEAGETFIQIEHAIGTSTITRYDADELTLTYSAIIYSLPI